MSDPLILDFSHNKHPLINQIILHQVGYDGDAELTFVLAPVNNDTRHTYRRRQEILQNNLDGYEKEKNEESGLLELKVTMPDKQVLPFFGKLQENMVLFATKKDKALIHKSGWLGTKDDGEMNTLDDAVLAFETKKLASHLEKLEGPASYIGMGI